MFPLSVAVVFALAPFALAQDSTAVKAIKAHFTQSAIVPDLFSSFDPSSTVLLNFPEVATTPTLSVTPGNSSITLSGEYTLAMVDADIVGAKLPEGQTRHWLVNGVTINGSTVSNSSAVGVTDYAGPWPASGSGPHRYVVVLYQQPSTFSPPAAYSQANIGVSVFDFPAYVQESKLGPLLAATYFTVQEGTATASISPTSAVISSTLAPSSSASKSGTSGGSSPTGTSGASQLSAHLFAVAAVGLIVAATI